MSECPRHPAAQTIAVKPQKGLVGEGAFDTMLESWLPVNYALNSLNRGIGVPDLHPFFLSSPALEKLRFIHDIISGQNGRNETKPANPGERLQKAS
jgi:hypothetical protein